MSDAPLPVMATVHPTTGVVSVRLLVETPVGLALYEGDEYFRIGQIRPGQWDQRHERLGTTTHKTGFFWYYDEPGYGTDNGTALTKPAALRALLKRAGYVQAQPNATNQGLF